MLSIKAKKPVVGNKNSYNDCILIYMKEDMTFLYRN